MIEFPKDEMIIHRASGVGYGVISELLRSQKSSKITKNWLFFHIFWGLEPYHPYIESNFSLVHTWLSVSKIKQSFIWRVVKDMGSHLGSKGPKNHQKSPKICNFSHIMGIRAISPIHWIKCLIGIYMFVCLNAESIIHGFPRVVCGVMSGLQRPRRSKKNHSKCILFIHIFAITESNVPSVHTLWNVTMLN